jgi:hypothetical protein
MRAEYQRAVKPGGTRIQDVHHAATKPVIAGIIYAVKALVSNAKLLKLGFGRSERSWGGGMALQGTGKRHQRGKEWSGLSESNRHLNLGKVPYYHYTKAALPTFFITLGPKPRQVRASKSFGKSMKLG